MLRQTEIMWTAPESGWCQFGPDVPPEAIGHYLASFASEPAGDGPPYVHTFASEPEPEAVITKMGWLLYDVNIRDDLTTFREDWTCFGKRHAESKARRELRKYKRVPYSYTLTQ